MAHWVKHQAPNAGDLGSSPGQGTRFQILQQRPGTVKQIQINKYLKKEN